MLVPAIGLCVLLAPSPTEVSGAHSRFEKGASILRVVIPVTGSRGDVQPYLALGAGLLAAGHQVRAATHTDFADAVRGRGLDFFPLAGDARSFHDTPVGRRMLSAGSNPFAYLSEFVRLREPWMQSLMANCDRACRDAEVVVLTATAFFVGLSVAEKRGLPICSTTLWPTNPSRHLANCLAPDLASWFPGRPLYNFGSTAVLGEYTWQLLRPMLNRARQEILDLPPLSFFGVSMAFLRKLPTLYGYSSMVVPKPLDWADNQHVTGYWFLESAKAWRPSAELAAFLEAGSPPVCIGFGSILTSRREAITKIVVEALRRIGRRGILLTGWGGLEGVRASDRLFVTDAAPHDWLFPRTIAVVHHGGAGTTAAAVRAGVPSLAIPFVGDQFFWGRQLFRLGVGPRPVSLARLSVGRLAGALRAAIGDEAMRQRAAELGQGIRDEDGVGQAVEAFQHSPVTLGEPIPAQTRRGGGMRRQRGLVWQE
jgi:UDP:flavonoid glycosyltransferase YjiC (YdhE family)